MKVTDVLSAVLSIEGATMARVGKSNFVAIPTETGWVKVGLTEALAKDTKTHKAFNAEAAIADYKVWEAQNALKAAEKASKPAKVTAKGPNPEAQARRDALDAQIADMEAFDHLTATDIMKSLQAKGVFDAKNTVMSVGSAAKRLVESGVLTKVVENDKSYYSKD